MAMRALKDGYADKLRTNSFNHSNSLVSPEKTQHQHALTHSATPSGRDRDCNNRFLQKNLKQPQVSETGFFISGTTNVSF